MNKLIIVGNGLDLAHGLKTSYRDFLNWYMCNSFSSFYSDKIYSDSLIEISNKNLSVTSIFNSTPQSFLEVIDLINSSINQSLKYNSIFFQRILEQFGGNNWVDIERYYFRMLKSYFNNSNIGDQKALVSKLNSQFDFIIEQLTDYINIVNLDIPKVCSLLSNRSKDNFNKIFESDFGDLKVLNFNYTATLRELDYIDKNQIIDIHGQASEKNLNPIIFGYGDESDPSYQSIEDSGENVYLDHIKSFGYFKTDKYFKLLSYIDSAPYNVYIIGHSCGLSDRVLLNEIFEHSNCQKIEIFYHRRKDGSDNFKEITQEISRHFKPHNKNVMRRKIISKNLRNVIPQNAAN